MVSKQKAAAYRVIMGQRLREVERILCAGQTPFDGVETSALLEHVAEAVRADPGAGHVWLLFTAVAGAFPTPVEHESLRRRLELCAPGEAGSIVLETSLLPGSKSGDWDRTLRIVESGTLVDVNFCARSDHNTGIQRVVRSVMPHLVAARGDDLTLVAWTLRNGAYRSIMTAERNRVLAWGSTGIASTEPDPVNELLVPWNSRVFLPEVPEQQVCERLAALAEFSGNSVSIIGYDTIPIGSADLVSPQEAERFSRYLSVIKHVDEVIAISESVAEEFRGFAAAVDAQALVSPKIHSIPLAADVPAVPEGEMPPTGPPLVIAVGSHEPRKNQQAVLFAIEKLLGEGLDFRFVFVGGGNRERVAPFDRALETLRAERGWDIQSVRGMRDAELFKLYRDARFSVFASIHEGYGLPVVESLASGTPVLTTNYGSLGEIATGGGCLTVDPRDDAAIVDALRRMLTDDSLIEKLTKQAKANPPRRWTDYANDLLAKSAVGVAP